MRGLIVAVGSNHSRGWLTTDHSASTHGLPVFVPADSMYAPTGEAMAAQDLATAIAGPMDLVSIGWAEWDDKGLHSAIGKSSSKPSFNPIEAVHAGFQFKYYNC